MGRFVSLGWLLLAAGGGILRDDKDNFIFGFASALGSCTVVEHLMHLESSFSIDHMMRKTNHLADSFAKNGLCLDNCSRIFYYVLDFACNALRTDGLGVFPLGSASLYCSG